MNRLRWQLATLFAWLFVFDNIERLHEPINIASFVYAYAAVIAMGFLLLPWLRRVPGIWTAGPLFGLFFVIKGALGYPIAGASLPITVTEICAIAVTAYLAQRIAAGLDEFEEAAEETLMIHLSDTVLSFAEGQRQIVQEVRRARRFGRPMSLVTVSATDGGRRRAVNKILAEMQQSLAERSLRSRLVNVIQQEIRECDIVTHRDLGVGGELMLVLPEADQATADEVARRIQLATEQELGITLQIGTSTFPEEELTLTGLMERAESEMKSHHLQPLGIKA